MEYEMFLLQTGIAASYPEVIGNQRQGQFWMNKLCDVRPELYRAISTTHLDPFHDDSILPEFFDFLNRYW